MPGYKDLRREEAVRPADFAIADVRARKRAKAKAAEDVRRSSTMRTL